LSKKVDEKKEFFTKNIAHIILTVYNITKDTLAL